MASDRILFDYLLRLADSDLVLAQRLGEWVGHGPALEEDIALTNIGLDLLGQARLWFAHAGEVEARFTGTGRSEDALAFSRDSGEFRNLLLVEQPNGSYADTMARQFCFDVWHGLLLAGLAGSRDARIAEIAAKELGIPRADVRVMATRTDKVPNTSATAASCGTDLNGAAVRNATNRPGTRRLGHGLPSRRRSASRTRHRRSSGS